MRGHLIVDVPFIAAAVSLIPVYGWTPLGWLTAAAVGIHAWGVVNPRSSLYMPVWWRLPAPCTGVALTFDDGPHPERTPAVLDLLAQHGQRATFFVIGENVRRYPALVRRIVAEGHALGLHSNSHSWMFNCWPPGRVQRDLECCGAAIADVTGRPAPVLFRPPMGLKNPIVGFVTGRMKLRTRNFNPPRWRRTESPTPGNALPRSFDAHLADDERTGINKSAHRSIGMWYHRWVNKFL